LNLGEQVVVLNDCINETMRYSTWSTGLYLVLNLSRLYSMRHACCASISSWGVGELDSSPSLLLSTWPHLEYCKWEWEGCVSSVNVSVNITVMLDHGVDTSSNWITWLRTWLEVGQKYVRTVPEMAVLLPLCTIDLMLEDSTSSAVRSMVTWCTPNVGELSDMWLEWSLLTTDWRCCKTCSVDDQGS